MEKHSRRRFLKCSAGCALASVCTPRSSQAYGEPIDIGKPSDFEIDTISEKFIRKNFFVIRRKNRLYTINATCPHEVNYLFTNPENSKEIACSGHDAYFDLDGSPLGGPVKKGLARFKITLDENGHALVDFLTEFPEEKWGEKDSFIEVK